MKSSGSEYPRSESARPGAIVVVVVLLLCPGPAGAVCRWNLTNVHLYFRWTHFAQGLQPSQGRLDWTHWSQACFEVVARVAEAEPFRRV
jgi:hypothetical protein